ncbi:P2R1A-PPP2R2A-interacting phosphatase regulator 1-like isoform X2 [Watersipora subatra]|uniref:P2R1A-PPP2R2A-interacting phosphatase regulator 1-like isoform X2 n=1 Tax=Watersipora subatra TaxID=2589382 RepID=UPI00355C5698
MAAHMEVDGEHLPPMDSMSNLKRCSSAPMINMLSDSAYPSFSSGSKRALDDTSKPITSSSLEPGSSLSLSTPSSGFKPVDSKIRSRHYSTSSLITASSSGNNVSTPIKVANRVHQIKQDEEVQTNVHREIKHERETQSAMQMSQSWEDNFSLEDSSMSNTDGQKNRPRSLSENLHIFTSGFPVASSPSPTRVGKQCFSPSMQAPVILNGNFNFSPSPSPSPTRRVTRRSLSPIVTLKPSTLSQKRKYSDGESGFSQPKRIFTSSSCSLLSPASLHVGSPSQVINNNLRLGVDLHTMRQHASSSLSTGSFDDSASEHSSVGAVSSAIHSTSSAQCGTFSPLPTTDNYSSTTTDSESDMFDCNTNNNNANSRSIDNTSATSSPCSTSVTR